MIQHLRSQRVMEIFRYYQAGVINTLFGLGFYSLLVWAGVGIYLAQLLSHVLGVVFNYLTYSRHVFRTSGPVKARFVLSYAANYLLSLGALAALMHFINNPYIAGILATFLVSVINYFVLKFIVFKAPAT